MASASATRCPTQPRLGDFEISDELTEFTFADDAQRVVDSVEPGAKLDRYEMLYSSSPVSVARQRADAADDRAAGRARSIVIHEANLVDYPGMNLAAVRMENRTLRAALAPWADGVKVRGHTPFVTPWRTIQLADRAIDLAPSVLGLKLNPPSRHRRTRAGSSR